MKIGIIKWMVGLVAAVLMVSSAEATLIFSESFEDTSSSALSGTGGGTGWGTNLWVASTGGGIRLEITSPASLIYPSGTSLSASGSRINTSVNGVVSSRKMETSISLANTYYMSFLARKDSTGVFKIETVNSANSRIRFGVGVNADGSVYSQSALTGIDTSDAGEFTDDTTYMVLVKTTSSRTLLALYEVGVDRAPADESEVVWLTEGIGSTSETQDTLKISISSGTVELDEIRLGNTFKSVTTAPRLCLVVISN